jgi:hypothetical protein
VVQAVILYAQLSTMFAMFYRSLTTAVLPVKLSEYWEAPLSVATFQYYCSSSYDLVKGDIRSRLIRLIPPASASSPQDAIRAFLAYRLPSNASQQEARDQWRDIVEGNSSLWKGIPTDRKETIRGSPFPSSIFLCLIWYAKAFLFTLRTNS